MPPKPTSICHITHIRNLPRIIEAGGLLPGRALKQGSQDYTDISYQDLQQRRANRPVTCGPKGMLHDYVPFYFCPRSPMLWALRHNRVSTYSEGQEPILHLVSTVETVCEADLPFVFLDGHALNAFSVCYDDVAQLDKIDWKVVGDKNWKNTQADNDRRRRKQAEFLVHQFFPWHLIHRIGVYSSVYKVRVEALLRDIPHAFPVEVCRQWYY